MCGDGNDVNHFSMWSVGVGDWGRNQCGDCVGQIWCGAEAEEDGVGGEAGGAGKVGNLRAREISNFKNQERCRET